jgi:hypothetical protein
LNVPPPQACHVAMMAVTIDPADDPPRTRGINPLSISALTMPNSAITIQTTSKTIVGKLKFTVNDMVSNAAPRKFDALNHKAFICVVRLL